VPPEQIAKAQIVPHPPANPTLRAAVPGKPIAPPPVRNHPMTTARPASLVGRPTRSENPRAAAPTSRAASSEGSARSEPLPRPGNREPVPPVPQRSITRGPPPPAIPFAQRHAAMLEHPGRPLEPPQIENLRAGRPAGSMRDGEFPPHVGPVVRERPAPPPPPRPPKK
jgi:hypothetical protein